ncbi:HAD family phosphatase [Rhodobacteraceae bacterium CCMM004]|nr:HAD family phosphatase [Rhodobacteraceae bacterium CCMM004]
MADDPGGALLFDLDGTLIDSDPLHRRVFAEMLGAVGIAVDAAFYAAEIHGRENPGIFARHIPDGDPHALSEEKEARFRAALGECHPAAPGAAAFLDRHPARPRAVVTNAPAENARAMLAAIGLADRFDVVVTPADVGRGKPDPAPYLEALSRLGADPASATVFEDSAPGLAAARAAGVGRIVGLTSALSEADLIAAGAHIAVADFTDTALIEGARP